MPFGLNIAPRIFTKVMAHIVKVMATEGIWCLPYLDDLLILAPTKEECLHHLDKAVKILEEFGWIINQEKSRKQPAQIFEWLGIHVDLKDHTVSATQAHMEDLQEQLKSVIKSKYTSKRKIMKMQGLANWIGQNNKIIRLMVSQTKILIRAFRKQRLDTPLRLTKGMKLSLIKWLNTPRIPQALGNPTPSVIIQTDASLTGWGMKINNRTFQGTFDHSMGNWSINALELLTIWFALLMVRERNQVIQVLCDNSTAVAAVRRSSSTIFHLAMISELIWRRAIMMGWTLTAAHIQGKFNIIADQLSRKVTVNRMVTTSERFQNDSENEPKTSGRPICYSLESQAKDLHIPMSRSTSGGHRCHGSAMGQMETSVPLSPVIADFEGFSQIDGNQVQKCYSSNPGNANQTLVHGIETTSNTINSDESSPTTSSSEQDGKSNQPDQTSRLEVIKAGYSKQHPLVPPEGIALMSKPVGGTSINPLRTKVHYTQHDV